MWEAIIPGKNGGKGLDAVMYGHLNLCAMAALALSLSLVVAQPRVFVASEARNKPVSSPVRPLSLVLHVLERECSLAQFHWSSFSSSFAVTEPLLQL